jgi:hypothetical protein
VIGPEAAVTISGFKPSGSPTVYAGTIRQLPARADVPAAAAQLGAGGFVVTSAVYDFNNGWDYLFAFKPSN